MYFFLIHISHHGKIIRSNRSNKSVHHRSHISIIPFILYHVKHHNTFIRSNRSNKSVHNCSHISVISFTSYMCILSVLYIISYIVYIISLQIVHLVSESCSYISHSHNNTHHTITVVVPNKQSHIHRDPYASYDSCFDCLLLCCNYVF